MDSNSKEGQILTERRVVEGVEEEEEEERKEEVRLKRKSADKKSKWKERLQVEFVVV